jgi:1-pyrroline-5-carboxylate dehydrogenase
VVFKPASDTPYMGLKLYEALAEAGLPPGVFNYITGPGGAIGDEFVSNPDVAGLVFTGSKEVGVNIYRKFNEQLPKPCITEMGGKNPAIVTAQADLEKAAEGVMRSAFGYGGQKCSACARVYVHRDVRKDFLDLLVEKTSRIKVGFPLDRDTFLGPVINASAYKTYQESIEVARRDGRILVGGDILTDEPFNHGYYVTPTVVSKLPKSHRFFSEELFLPILVVADVRSIEEAVELANRSEYGLTAGIFSNDLDEIRYFFDHIEAGVTYANRPGGATTGAWPGIQSFGGWKASGSSGKGALGPYYVQQFMREQSQTIVE